MSLLRRLPPKTIFYFVPVAAVVALHLLGFRYVVVLTDSMEPTIPKGSLALTAPTWLAKPSNGSVILYRVRLSRGEYLIMHRVVAATPDGLATKGDNRRFRDPWLVPPSSVVGVELLHAPLAGYALLLARPLLVALAAGVAAYTLVRQALLLLLERRRVSGG